MQARLEVQLSGRSLAQKQASGFSQRKQAEHRQACSRVGLISDTVFMESFVTYSSTTSEISEEAILPSELRRTGKFCQEEPFHGSVVLHVTGKEVLVP